LLFKGGNVLDIQLATDPATDPKRTKPAPGDLRLLISRQAAATPGAQPKTVAVIYRPKVKGFTGKPETLSSPTGSEPFDTIEQTERIKLDYKSTPGIQGFDALLTIPRSTCSTGPRNPALPCSWTSAISTATPTAPSP
jgi:hypothetical protein